MSSQSTRSSHLMPMVHVEDSGPGQLSTVDQDASIVHISASNAGRSPEDNTRDRATLRQSFFQSSNGVSTSGGQFLTGTNINLNNNTYNYYGHHSAAAGTGEIGSSGTNPEAMLEPELRYTETHPTYPEPPSFPVMNSRDIYGRHIAIMGHGYPLWNPEPDINLPIDYQRQGIAIGDVGIITSSGEFDYKFNICRPADHPFNVGEVPDNFVPFEPTLKPTDIRKRCKIKMDSAIASASVTRIYGAEHGSQGSEPCGFAFEATASEGAILAIPNGAISEDLRNIVGFRRYISANLLSWYRYMKSRGWEVKNGDIRLVIGMDKTTDWGMAVFSSLSNKEGYFRLTFKPAERRSGGAMYKWECSGNSEAKSGPDAFEIDALRTQDDGDAEPTTFRNQCPFVRTLNPTLRDDIWKMLESEFETAQDVETSSMFENTGVQFIDFRYHPMSFFDSLNTPGQPSGTQDSFRRNTTIANPQASANVAHTMHLASLAINQIQHPSESLNMALLKHYPNSEMVITSDNDWINAVTSNDTILPSSDELLSRILSKNTICQGEVLFLKASDLPGSQLEHDDLHAADRMNLDTLDSEIDTHSPESLSYGTNFKNAGTNKPSMPVTFLMVQPMKAALFDSAEGFGEWRILISTRADRDLRDARRRDAKSFKIIIKKIKELSNGHFSDDNQKRLNGANTEIPIYEAKMTSDSRLVYQIDCIPEYDASIEKQIIKIFGVYTHAQFDKRLWDSVGYQLARKGKDYRQRCTFRNKPQIPGDNVYTPACFPPAEYVSDEEHIGPELPRESLEEMHSLLVLEKFVPFSQALLNSIIADLDVAHVFNVSPQEMEIVQYPYSCYVLGRSGTGKTTTMLFKMLGIERAYALRKDSMSKPRQLFVTQSRVLAGKVEEYFSKLLQSLSTAEKTREELAQLIKEKKQQQEDNGLIDIDDDHNWRGDLPQKFSQLEDKHFPLFLTFDRLTSLLEADILQSMPAKMLHMTGDVGEDANRASTLVTYNIFLKSYWPHFSQNLKKGLDPALVFSEMMGVIQGSEESLNHGSHFLDKTSYENLSHRAQYAFATRRDVIYSIFQLYLKQKRLNQEYDAADRTHRILNAFQSCIPGQKIDFLYVDEAQDNLLIDALLLRSLVRNPDGLFWAGDTAQTISVGSSFRFNDLKAFLFRLEQRRESSALDSNLAPLQEAPKTFHLAMNYRSHGGIIQCAHSVIELITKFWPYAIDVLSREKGVVDGSKPVFFSGWDSDTVRYEQFLFGESGSPIEFGAQQCILVRDEAAKEELRSQVGDIGLIMTLYESKGLEFDDVLLYKFFEDSTVDLSQWRVVLNLLTDMSAANHQGMAAPRFDEVKHAGVCSELKFLYVAITRARKNLWLVDCSEKSEPMRIFWTSRNEIQNCTPGTDVPRLAVSSSPQEWEKSGRTLFTNKRYLQAMHCFERAGLNREVAVAHTYYLREQARSFALSGTKQDILSQQQAFLVAAEAFLQCSGSATTAKETKAYLRNAGDCFVDAKEDYKAADAYSRAEEYNTAVKLYRKCAKFDEAVHIVTQNRQKIDIEVAENIIDIAKLFYFKGGELEKATKLFKSVEEQLEYLEDFDLDVSRAALLEKLGKFQDAADIHFTEGRTLEAIRLYLMDEKDEGSVRRGYQCILEGLWQKVSFAVKGLNRLDDVVRLLDLGSKVKILDALDSDELTMFQALNSGNIKVLPVLGRKFNSKGVNYATVLCFDHYFDSLPVMYSMTASQISETLADFEVYCSLLSRLVNTPNPCDNESIQKLFSIVPSSENTFFLPVATFLHQQLLESRTPLTGSNEQGVYVSEWELSRKLKQCIVDRLQRRIIEQNNECTEAQVFNPCASFIVGGYCNRIQCPHLHVKPTALTSDWYNLQVKIHLQQITVLQPLLSLSLEPLRKIIMRQWITRIFETFYPLWFRLGDVVNINFASSPRARNALGILKGWCMELLFWSRHPVDVKLLTTIYHVTKLLFHLDRPAALTNVFRAPLMNMLGRLPQYYRIDGKASVYVIPELVHALSTVSADSLVRGIIFIKHVLDKMLPIDVNVLCQAIEFLCGAIVFVQRKFALHNVTLPRSWLSSLLAAMNLSNPDSKGDINPQAVHVLVGSLRNLVDSLYMGKQQTSHLLADKSDLFMIHGLRNIYLTRLCRAICLLGYNMNNISLRGEIVRIMRSLKAHKPPHSLFREYANVRGWGDVTRSVHNSMPDSELDELVQLYSENSKSTTPPLRTVRRIVFKHLVDIPRLLDNKQPVFVSNLRADAPEFVPKPRVQEASPEDDTELDQDVEEPEVDNTQIINTAVSVESITVAALPEANLPPSDDVIKATLFVQSKYKKMRRLRESKMSSLGMSRASCFDACLAESLKIDWPQGSYYRLLFLGPLPHILVCLKAAHTWTINTKKRNKKRFKSAKHQELEDVIKRLTEQKKMLDRVQALQRALEPPSELHRRRDIEELKVRVLEVEALLGEIASDVAQEVGADMAMGKKGIVAVRKAPKPKTRPHLRIDDDDGYDYAEEDIKEEEAEQEERRQLLQQEVHYEEGNLDAGPAHEEQSQSGGCGCSICRRSRSIEDGTCGSLSPATAQVQASLTWVSVPPASADHEPHTQDLHRDHEAEDEGEGADNADDSEASAHSGSTDHASLVMQSLSWIPI